MAVRGGFSGCRFYTRKPLRPNGLIHFGGQTYNEHHHSQTHCPDRAGQPANQLSGDHKANTRRNVHNKCSLKVHGRGRQRNQRQVSLGDDVNGMLLNLRGSD